MPPRYHVKLPYGRAFLSPSAVLFNPPSKDTSYIRRDGAMVRDDSLFQDTRVQILGEKYRLLFATESVYLFLRLFLYTCTLVTDTHDYCDANPAPRDPALSYCKSLSGKDDDAKHQSSRLNFCSVLSALRKVVAGQMTIGKYEALGRKVSMDKVHQMAALPKLLNLCASALVKCADEDDLLLLNDICHHRSMDPAVVQGLCLSVVPEAFYRIQFDQSTGEMCFAYTPTAESLCMQPRDEIAGNSGRPAMEIDPITQFGECQPLKKQKTK